MLTIRNTEAIRQIEAAIGYTFHDKRLLVQVLTRKTYLKIDPEAPDNEVLEFYGDTLMNYHVTNYFMAKYAHMLEDGLFFMRTVEQFTDLRSHYVCNRYLTERVKALGLARYLRAQNRDAELRRDGEKAYADVFESLVGAIYLDSYQNDTLIRAFILRQLGIEPRRTPTEIEAFDYDTLRDIPEDIPYDEPDEAMIPEEPADEAIPAPNEAVDAVEETPDEMIPEVTSLPEAVVETVTETVTAAEPAALAEPAEQTAETSAPVEVPVSVAAPVAPATNRERLAALCEQLGYDQPTYGETPPNAPNARPVAACTLKYRDAKGKQVKISLNDSGRTLAEATEKVAAKMLAKVEKHTAEATVKPAVKPEKPARFKAEKHPAQTEPAVEAAPVMEAPAVESVPAEEVAPVAEAVVMENTPVEEIVPVMEAPTAETAPAEETPVAETPAVEIMPAEESAPVAETAPVTEAPVAEATPTPEVTPTEETKPVKKTPAKKRSSSKKKPATEEKPAEAAPVSEPVTETVTETPAEPAPETAPAEEVKPAKKAPAKKKAASKKKPEATEDKPAEEVKTETAEVKAEDKPAKAKKPSTRKPRAKRETPAEDKPDAE